MEKTSTDILNEAADLLEEEGRWGQKYFLQNGEDPSGPACVMCVHGAIAYCGNSEVRECAIKNIDEAARKASNFSGPVISSSTPFSIKASGLSPKQYFQKYFPGSTEIALAHYRAAKAGLTFSFNDAPERTQQEVVAKLREAAQNPIE